MSLSVGVQRVRLAGVAHSVMRSAEKRLASLEESARNANPQRDLFDAVADDEAVADAADDAALVTEVFDALVAMTFRMAFLLRRRPLAGR